MIVTDPDLRARMVAISERARSAAAATPSRESNRAFSAAYAEFEACCATLGRRPPPVGDVLAFTGVERTRKGLARGV